MNLASKDPIQVSLTYDGSNFLVESLKDLSTGATFSTTFNVGSLASVVGGSTAYAGFTAGRTGGDNATQTISSFSSNLSYMASAAGNNMLPTSTALSIAAGATLDLYGGSQTVGSLSGQGAVNDRAGTLAELIVSGSATTTFSGSISGPGGGIGLEKLGSGTLILSGTDSYQLGTTVEGSGTLIVTQAGGLADQSNLTVGNPSSFGAVIPDAAANGTPRHPTPRQCRSRERWLCLEVHVGDASRSWKRRKLIASSRCA